MNSFKPTHMHADGGEYEYLGTIKVRLVEGLWVTWTHYRAADGTECARETKSWEKRFSELTKSQLG